MDRKIVWGIVAAVAVAGIALVAILMGGAQQKSPAARHDDLQPEHNGTEPQQNRTLQPPPETYLPPFCFERDVGSQFCFESQVKSCSKTSDCGEGEYCYHIDGRSFCVNPCPPGAEACCTSCWDGYMPERGCDWGAYFDSNPESIIYLRQEDCS